MATDKNLGQQSNPNWDDQNDKRNRDSQQEPNPERYEDANLGQGSGSLSEQNERSESTERDKHEKGGSAFNERHESTVGAGTGQRDERQNVGPLDADLNELPSQKRSGNQTGPGLG